MIRAEQIPPEAMYAAWKAMNAGLTLNDAIAAALNAWPGVSEQGEVYGNVSERWLELPLPQEVSDE